MSAIDELKQFLKIHPRISQIEKHYIKLLLETICEGSIKQIAVEGKIYEVYADIVETEE